MTKKRFKCVSDYDWWGVIDTTGEIKGTYDNDCFSTDIVVDLLNTLTEENKELKKENKELNSVKCFADNNGINVFNINEAFRRCWNDNEKLVIKNNELQEKNDRQAKQLNDIYQLIEQKDWRALMDIMDDFEENGRVTND